MITEDMVDVAAKYMWGAPTNQQRMLTKQVLVTAFAKAPRTEQFKDAITVLKVQWKHAFPGSSGHTALLIIDMLSILEAQQTALIKHREAKIDKMDSVIKNFSCHPPCHHGEGEPGALEARCQCPRQVRIGSGGKDHARRTDMKVCTKHWDMMKEAVETSGMSSLISADSEHAIARTKEELEGGLTADNFDPLLQLGWHFTSEALRCGGLYLMFTNESGENDGHYCPLCEFESHYDGWDSKKQIENIAGQMAEWAREEGLIPKVQ